jgi:N-acetylglucosamine-6-phosphate deacetylase
MTKATPNPILSNVDIINAKVPGYQDLQMIWVNEDGIIEQILPMGRVCQRNSPPDLQILDVAGDWISFGGVDIQINGGLGLAFPELTEKNIHRLEEISQFLWDAGVVIYQPW